MGENQDLKFQYDFQVPLRSHICFFIQKLIMILGKTYTFYFVYCHPAFFFMPKILGIGENSKQNITQDSSLGRVNSHRII